MNAAATRSLAQKAWPIANGVMLLVCIVLGVLFFSGGDQRSEQAMQEGHQILINLADGGILGYVHRTRKEAEPKAAAAMPDRSAPLPESLPEEPVIESALPGDFTEHAQEPTETVANPVTMQPKAEIPEVDAKELAPPADYVAPEPIQLPASQFDDTAEDAGDAAYDEDTEEVEEAAPDEPRLEIPKSAGRPLRHAPQPELSEKTATGVLPKIGEDGSRPWKIYGKLEEYKVPGGPLVSIIVTGLGLGRFTTEAAFELPENFTLSFSPYARKIDMWAGHARNIGHEVLLDLPMQTTDFPATDPGPYALMNIKQAVENRERLHWLMERFPGAIGFMAPHDAEPPDAVMLSAMADIGGRGLLFVDVEGAAAEMMDSKKSEMGLIDITAAKVVDMNLSESAIKTQLDELEALAKEKGYAVGIARAYPVTMKQLKSWYAGLAKKGLHLAPLSAIADKLE